MNDQTPESEQMMARVRQWFARQNRATLIVAGVLTIAVLGVGFVGVARATDQPGFCRSCHEMRTYHEAWSQGPHKDASCVDCHVDAGQVQRLQHKFIALGEVVSHVRGDRSFPRPAPAEVPDERCRRCHQQIEVENLDFDHAFHAGRGPCVKCHATVGHSVTVSVLRAAGIYSGVAPRHPSADTSKIAVVDGGKADLPGHAVTYCPRCHIMSATLCSACHTPPHAKRGACATCHAPGITFVFSHPKNRSDCQTCHAKGAKHTTIKGECSTCHKKSGVAWSFGHPGPAANCTGCHDRPAGHRSGPCSTCHAAGASWVFLHPPGSANCTNCHTRPAKHRPGACSTCHGNAGVSWAFRHPGAGARCTNCHGRPRGHSAGGCTSCHVLGRSWAFRHPSSSRCPSCHRTPSNHYGSSCSSCHSPTRAWRSATFRHARIPGGEHSYRSFACVNCHPRSYSSSTCAKCHDSASGPRDD